MTSVRCRVPGRAMAVGTERHLTTIFTRTMRITKMPVESNRDALLTEKHQTATASGAIAARSRISDSFCLTVTFPSKKTIWSWSSSCDGTE